MQRLLFQKTYEYDGLSEYQNKAYRKAVRAVVLKEGKILMLKTVNGDYKFPGGGVKRGEEEQEALRREVLEEAGYCLDKIEKHLGTVVERKKDSFKENTLFEMESLYFLCQVEGEQGPQKLDGYEMDLQLTPVWVSLDQAIEGNEKVLYKSRDIHFRWILRETDILKELKKLDREKEKITTVYFVRHAEPAHGHKEDKTRPLTPDGLSDSEKVTEFFNEKEVHAYYSSPYLRSTTTIQGSAEEKGLKITELWDLRERENGKSENTKDMIRRRWQDFDFHEEGGESLSMVQKRNREALSLILNREAGKTVVVGTHGTALSTILNSYQPSFHVEDFFRIIDFMPYIIKLRFRGEEFLDMKEEFYVHRPYNRK